MKDYLGVKLPGCSVLEQAVIVNKIEAKMIIVRMNECL